jgi:uncharacterized membrane protein YuzA (DUF378 family)
MANTVQTLYGRHNIPLTISRSRVRLWTVLGQTLDKEVNMKALKTVTGILVVVGALNWGLVAVAKFDLVAAIFGMEFGETNALTRIVYGLVGLSAIVQAAAMFGDREMEAPGRVRSAA